MTNLAALDRTRLYLAPAPNLAGDDTSAVHLALLQWHDRLEAWAVGRAVCGETTEQRMLPSGTAVTCGGCEARRAQYEQSLPSLARPLDTPENGAWHSVWLHGHWDYLTANMTLDQREHAADGVEAYSRHLAQVDGEPYRPAPEGLRWWREENR